MGDTVETYTYIIIHKLLKNISSNLLLIIQDKYGPKSGGVNLIWPKFMFT